MRNVTAVLFESSMVKLTRCLFPLTCVLMALLLSSAGTAWAQEPDAEGSKDHPAFSRLQGYYINNYDEQEFSVFEFSLDPARRVEGHYWEIQYVLKEGARKAGALQIGRNYTNLIKQRGGALLREDLDSLLLNPGPDTRAIYLHCRKRGKGAAPANVVESRRDALQARLAAERGARVVVNLAPVVDLPADVLRLADPLRLRPGQRLALPPLNS